MNNILQLTHLWLTGGSPTLNDFKNIKAAGYQVVINLALSTSPGILPGEAELVSQLGMEYIHIPVRWESPSLSDLYAFFEALDQNSDHKIFIHCVKNMRVSAFIFLYRVLHQGWSVEAARPDLFAIWRPTDQWLDFINSCLSDLHLSLY